MVEVQGYDASMHKTQNPPSGSLQKMNSQQVSTVTGNAVSQLMVEGSMVVQGRAEEAPVIGSHRSERANPDFEEIIRDIDESINAFSGNSNLNLDLDKRLEYNEERMLLDVPVLVADSTQMESEWRKDKMGSVIQCEVVSGCEFQAGWTSGDRGKVGRGLGSNKCVERKRCKTKQSHARDVRAQDSNSKVVGPKKSTWSRIPQRSTQNPTAVLADEGPKRKNSEQSKGVEDSLVFVKKFRLEEKALPVNMINQCLSVEAAM